MPSQQQNSDRITKAQELFNTEITALAADLGVAVPSLVSGEYEAGRYDQLAGQAERNARAVASVRAAYAKKTGAADDSDDDDTSDDSDPAKPARRGRKPSADNA